MGRREDGPLPKDPETKLGAFSDDQLRDELVRREQNRQKSRYIVMEIPIETCHEGKCCAPDCNFFQQRSIGGALTKIPWCLLFGRDGSLEGRTTLNGHPWRDPRCIEAEGDRAAGRSLRTTGFNCALMWGDVLRGD